VAKLILHALFSLISVAIIHTVANADVTTRLRCITHTPTDVQACGVVSGEIKVGDIAEVSWLIKELERPGYRIIFHVDSGGGDVRSAIEIGRLFRKARVRVFMGDKKSKCLSSCVFLLAGAVYRFPTGTVGIHRPYSSDVKTRSYDETQRIFRDLEILSKQFLSDMNLPAALFDAMMRVPPQNIRRLSLSELSSFGLLGTDPVEQEVEDTEKAQRLGISRQELLSRKSRAEQVCDKYLNMPFSKGENYFTCTESVLRAPQ
jgi:hypothetical protein